jgi:ribosome maturation factor RimP
MPSIAERVLGIVAPLVEAAGLELYDLEHAGGVVRVLVAGGGIDDLSALSRSISRALDEADPIEGHYTLEVSTPGVERVLRTPAHYAGAIGSDVSVKTLPGTEGERRLAGVLLAATDSGITVRSADGAERTVPFADIEKARTTFAWGPPPKPGGPKKKQPTT